MSDKGPKVAIISGGSQGIGASLVTAYRGKAGAWWLPPAPCKPAEDPDVLTVDGDLADPATADRIVSGALGRFGRMDTLINNAGVYISKPWFASAYQVLAQLAPEVARRVHPNNYEAILNALVRRMAGEASNKVRATPFAFAVYCVDRGEAQTDRRIETTLDAQIRDGLLEETAELDRRYRLVEQARRPGRRRNVASQTHGYREFVRVAASTGKAIAELDGANLAAARAEALGHIWAYSRRQRSWFRKLGASRVGHRSAVKIIVSRLQ